MALAGIWFEGEYFEKNFDGVPQLHNLLDHARKGGLGIPRDLTGYAIKGLRTGNIYKKTDRPQACETVRLIKVG